MKAHIKYGGRGTGRPLDKFMYGRRICIYVTDYRTKEEANKLANKFEKEGILAIVRKWYSRWVVYRCGARKR